jgi:HD superfamily phosphohydrolase YqeK
MVVYLADATEPSREKKFAAPVRKTFKEKGLENAVLHAINNKLLEVIQKGKKIHPLTIKARNWLIDIITM